MRDGERESARDDAMTKEDFLPSSVFRSVLPACALPARLPSGQDAHAALVSRIFVRVRFRDSPFFIRAGNNTFFPPKCLFCSNVSVSSDFALRARAKLGIKGRKVTGADRGMTMIFFISSQVKIQTPTDIVHLFFFLFLHSPLICLFSPPLLYFLSIKAALAGQK